jgi:hypothetical protein
LIHLFFVLVLLGAAGTFALLEIQIEGRAGWASALPTWRLENRWTRLLLGSRALTGYHLYVHLFILIFLHLPYALGFVAPSLKLEARLVAFLILFWIIEDYLWFVFNRDFGARKFRREHIWWHAPAWWWIMPREYWLFTPVGIGLYLWSWG